jgi:hypothetical protein
MVGYSIVYEPYKNRNTNEYVFFIKVMPGADSLK